MKKIFLIITASLLALSGFAQRVETEMRYDTLDIDYKTKYTSKFFDNFYIQASFAERLMFGEEDTQLKFSKRVQPGFQIAVGKKLFPAFGVRLGFGGARLNGWNSGIPGFYQGNKQWTTDPTIDPLKLYYESKGISTANGYIQKLKYTELNADFMWDLLNTFGKSYRFDRKFELEAYAGMGWLHLTKWHAMPKNDKVSLRIGAQGTWNITQRLGLNLEYNYAITDATFDGEIGKGHKFDGFMSALLGLTYRVGKQGFTVVRLISPESYAMLNNRISMIRREVEEQPQEIIQITDQITQISLLIPSVVFNPGKDTFNEELQLVNIFKVAKFMKENPDQDVTIIGNVEGNDEKLARQRAQVVKDILVNRYSIDPSRLSITVQNVNNDFNVTGYSDSVNFSITQ
ncbi:MAG: hypothetical protein RR202_05730 [Bacteroidales bacterium]